MFGSGWSLCAHVCMRMPCFYSDRAASCRLVLRRPEQGRILGIMVSTSSDMMSEEVDTMKPRLRTRSGPLCMVCTGLIRVVQTLPIGPWAGRVHTASPGHCAGDTSAGVRAPSDAHIASEGSFIQ